MNKVTYQDAPFISQVRVHTEGVDVIIWFGNVRLYETTYPKGTDSEAARAKGLHEFGNRLAKALIPGPFNGLIGF